MFVPTGSRLDKYVFLALVLAALGIAGFAGHTAYRWSMARRWPAAPCVITASTVEDVGGHQPYVFRVRYRYTWRGQQHEGNVYSGEDRGTWDVAEADRLARTYPAGSRRACYVNPIEPSRAVLEHDPIWLPVALAAGMLMSGAILARAYLLPGGGERALEAWAGPVILLMGGGCYAAFFGIPLWQGIRSLSWTPTPCVVRSAEVRSHFHGGQHPYTVYWPDILYEYRVKAKTYRANTYNVSDVGSPWYYGARGVVRRHPPGLPTTCYINPADPSEATLVRVPSGTQWFGAWPLIMTILGMAGTLQTVVGRQIRVGSPRLWGSLALWAATAVAIQVLLVTGTDLIRDRRAGVAEPLEYLAVAIAGAVSAALLVGRVRSAIRQGRRTASSANRVASRLRDRDSDG